MDGGSGGGDDDFSSVAWDTGVSPSPQPPDQDAHSGLAGRGGPRGDHRNGGGEIDFEVDAEFNLGVPRRTTPSLVRNEIGAGAPGHNTGDTAMPRRFANNDEARTSAATSVDYALVVVVSDPQKHEDKEPYVSYLVTAKTSLETFAHGECQVRRRFQDFVWLKNTLKDEFPHCIVPPLPEKHSVLDYIVTDRFSPAFLEKRRCSLERYLNRIARHPALRTSSSLRTFLESKDFNLEAAEKQRASTNVFENLGDTLLNAFTKIKQKDERFVELEETVDKFEQNLSSIARVYPRVIKRQGELDQGYTDFGNALLTLGSMETDMEQALNDFARALEKFVQLTKEMSQEKLEDFVSNLHEYLGYCHNAKTVLKLRDQKQLDVEELSDYLHAQVTERERTQNPGWRSGSLLSTIKGKYEEMTGADQEQMKHDKLEKLKFRIAELQEAVQTSGAVAEAFDGEVIKEFGRFEAAKLVDFKHALGEYTSGQMEFYEKAAELWKNIIPVLERTPTED